MLECVSSGYCANVAEVYHGSGTRSQSVSGLAECVPGALLAFVGRALWASYGVRPLPHTNSQSGSRDVRDAEELSYRSSARPAN